MKVFIVLNTIILTVILSSCSNENKSSNTEFKRDIKAKIVELNDQLMGMPAYRSTIVEDHFIIYDWIKSDDKFLFDIDLKRNVLNKKILDVGWGPCEFSTIKGITSISKTEFGFQEPNKKKFFSVKIDQLKDDQGCPTELVEFFDNNGENVNFTDVVPLNDIYIGFGVFNNSKMYSVHDSNGQYLNSYIDYPEIGIGVNPEDLPLLNKQLHFGNLNKHPSKNRVACITRAGLLSIVDLEGLELKSVFSEMLLTPKFTWQGNRLKRDKDSEIGFILGAVSENYIYIGIDRRTMNEAKKDGNSCAEFLVFDWNGNEISRLYADKPLCAMSFDLNRLKLYGISNLPEPTLVYYDMSDFDK